MLYSCVYVFQLCKPITIILLHAGLPGCSTAESISSLTDVSLSRSADVPLNCSSTDLDTGQSSYFPTLLV